MFDGFTDAAKRALAEARTEALRLNHECLGAEHILLGLLQAPASFGASLIRHTCGSLDVVRAEVEQRSGPGCGRSGLRQMPFASSARDVLELSMTEAHQLQSRIIGTEHLLLGILRLASPHPGKEALTKLGMGLDACREIVRQHGVVGEDRGPAVL